MQEIQNRTQMNQAVEEFYKRYSDIFISALPLDPDPEVIGSLLAEYHQLIAPYIIEHETFIFSVLLAWSTGQEKVWGKTLIEAETNEENGIALGYLWGVGLDKKYIEAFAGKLSESDSYNQDFLPEPLRRYWPTETRCEPLS